MTRRIMTRGVVLDNVTAEVVVLVSQDYRDLIPRPCRVYLLLRMHFHLWMELSPFTAVVGGPVSDWLLRSCIHYIVRPVGVP